MLTGETRGVVYGATRGPATSEMFRPRTNVCYKDFARKATSTLPALAQADIFL